MYLYAYVVHVAQLSTDMQACVISLSVCVCVCVCVCSTTDMQACVISLMFANVCSDGVYDGQD
jgi:hypothetical protein